LDVVSINDYPKLDVDRPLLIVDVDGVLALFFPEFAKFLATHGLELKAERYALFQNIYRPGEDQHLDVAIGKELLDDFYRSCAETFEPAPGAAEALRSLSALGANVVILSNAPDFCRGSRARWLARHDMDYPLIINNGAKGGPVRALANRTRRPVAFVDDLPQHLASAAEAAPDVLCFQMVADERLRAVAPDAPSRYRRIDDWALLHDALAEALGAYAG
jgi:hypothetical protein